MSIAALNQVYDEMRRLAIAGGNLASGDFRLKKLVEPLKTSAVKAPVFGKVAEAVEKVVDGPPKESATALLELSTLVTAILYTQGQTGAEGKIEPIPTTDFGMPSSSTSARVLKPLIEALTTTGSGREEIIKDAHQRGAFQDLRLVRPALAAIDDVYQPIADFVAEQILPLYGKAIYEDLEKQHDPKAKGGAVRRLTLMHRLDPERTAAHVQAALDSGSADMKVAAIECLEGSKEALPFLLEQAKARSSDVRRAALGAMATFTETEVVEGLIKALSGADLALAIEPASRNRSPQLLAFLLAQGEKQLEEVLVTGKKKVAGQPERFQLLLIAFKSRNDPQSIALLTKCFERREEIDKAAGDGIINHRVAELLMGVKQKPLLKLIADAHATLSPELIRFAWLAAAMTRSPKEVYDQFAPYYRETSDEKKKKKAEALTKRDALREVVMSFAGRRLKYHYFHYDTGVHSIEIDGLSEEDLHGELDPRWLDAAVDTADIELVTALARPKHKATQTFLSQQAEEFLKQKDADYRLSDIYDTMIRIEHPQVVEHFLSALKKTAGNKRNNYYYYWLARLIPSLPKSAVPQIEELLPTLGDGAVDQIAPYLAELQAKT